jgi:hypothetical protein
MIEMTSRTHTPSPDECTAITHPEVGLNPMWVQPQQGQVYHLAGSGRSGTSMRPIAEYWVAHALAQQRVVHWVDGACRIDPSRLIPLLESRGADVEACLAKCYLSRGFTLHQLDRQLERLPDELKITRSPLVVVDGLLAMHEDDAISNLESRMLLRRHLRLLRGLAEQQQIAVVVITEASATSRIQQRLVQHVYRHAQNHLNGRWRGPRRRRTLQLRHPRSGLSGPWQPLHDPLQMRWKASPQQHLRPTERSSAAQALPLHHREP